MLTTIKPKWYQEENAKTLSMVTSNIKAPIERKQIPA